MFKLNQIKSIIAISLTLAASAPAPALANVSLKNGNFFIGYTDIMYQGGFEPKIERVYNSKTEYSGMFGPGWGSEYEVSLSVSADGSVVVHEYGGGAENRFSPVAYKGGELDAAVNTISAAALKAGMVGSGAAFTKYKQDLKNSATFRNDQWEALRKMNKLQARTIPTGTQLHSNRFSYQYITKVAGGYIRTFDSGRLERYDEGGHIVRIQDRNNNFIDFKYGEDGHLQKLTDNFNRKMFFTFNNKGLLDKIDGENGKASEFKYNGIGELVYSKDVDGNIYTYQYDKEQRHNLMMIGYSDKTNQTISYYGMDKKESVKAVKDRDGTVTSYTYENDPTDHGHYAVAVNTKTADGQVSSDSKYEYFMRHKADGEEWTYKLTTTLDGERTETTYNECCGLPLLIKTGGEETAFEYDTKGHVTKKVTPNEITELTYSPTASKVSRVVRYSKTNKKDVSWSTFEYDNKANLVLAKNSEGKGVRLFYDNVGRIRSMVDQSKRRIDFKYNESSRPIEITDPSLGSITVSYTNSGEIKKVESSAGRKIALQVTSAFQNLLDIIRPAGVSLSF